MDWVTVSAVAWHGDTIGRGGTHDTLVAIVSFGSPRTLARMSHAPNPMRAMYTCHTSTSAATPADSSLDMGSSVLLEPKTFIPMFMAVL